MRTDVGWTGQVEEVVALGARTASGDTGLLSGYGPVQRIRAQLLVTAVSGTTPTLDVLIEDTLDNVNWLTIASPDSPYRGTPGMFPRVTAAGLWVMNLTEFFSDRLRLRWTIGGASASFTFGVTWLVE